MSKNKICKQCGAQYTSRFSPSKFCSRSCAATYNNKKYPKRIKDTSNKCQNCGKTVNRGRKFCNYACNTEYNHKTYIERWLNGKESGVRGKDASISRHIRSYLFEQNDNKCQYCGWSETHPITEKIPLQVDHIDGDCWNNTPENLRLLCPNCHSLTETYGSLNKNGRKSRGAERLR